MMSVNPFSIRVYLGEALYSWLDSKGVPVPIAIRQIVQKEHNREKGGALNTHAGVSVPVVAIEPQRAQIKLYIGPEIAQGLQVPEGEYILYLSRGPS